MKTFSISSIHFYEDDLAYMMLVDAETDQYHKIIVARNGEELPSKARLVSKADTFITRHLLNLGDDYDIIFGK